MPTHDYNPFTEATAGKYFVGREEQLRQFTGQLNGLTARSPAHTYLVGVHGTGKSSFLERLVFIAKSQEFAAGLVNLDAEHLAFDHVGAILRCIVESVDERLSAKGTKSDLLSDWDKKSTSQVFHYPRSDKLVSEVVKRDLRTIQRLTEEAGIAGVVVCIDEGQRIAPTALSAVKNAVQSFGAFLFVLSLRVIVDSADYSIADGRTLLDAKAKEAEGDFGASRIFVNGISMGPFQTPQEAAGCILRRLENNRIQFAPPVIERIVRISARIPREIITVASNVYDRARARGQEMVDLSTLNDTFRELNRSFCADATTLCGNVSAGARAALGGLIQAGSAATPAEIAARVYPGLAPEIYRHVEQGIQGDLDRVCAVTRLCRSIEGKYSLIDSVASYALELALGSQ